METEKSEGRSKMKRWYFAGPTASLSAWLLGLLITWLPDPATDVQAYLMGTAKLWVGAGYLIGGLLTYFAIWDRVDPRGLGWMG